MAEDDSGKILTDLKAALGLQPDYDPFDLELKMHINSILAILNQLGVGPEEGFIINDDTPWSDLLEDSKIENVKLFIFTKLKIVFDSNTMPAHVLAAYERIVSELEFRLCVATDPMIPQTPPDIDIDDEELILDGGGA